MKIKLLILIITLKCALNPLSAGSVIIVMGPSCVGKSTTIKTLTKELDETWQIVDFDELEIASKAASKVKTNETLFKQAIQETNDLLAQNYNVIIDTNVYFAEHEHLLSATKAWRLLLYAPLDVLLTRDNQRTINNNRPTQRAHYAQEYVIETFERFFDNNQIQNPKARVAYDCLLSTNSSSCKDELLNFIKNIQDYRDRNEQQEKEKSHKNINLFSSIDNQIIADLKNHQKHKDNHLHKDAEEQCI